MLYTEPRYTKDLDIWVSPDRDNADRVFRSLAEFGAPLKGITAEEFAHDDLIYQLGVAPVRIDIVTSLSGLDFEAAWGRRTNGDFGGFRANFLGIEDLIVNKRKVGRYTDLADCERLEESRGQV